MSVQKSIENDSVSLLPTAKVRVRISNSDQWYIATLLFDCGSDRSYVSSELVREVKPHFLKIIDTKFSTFGGRSRNSKSKLFDLCVKGSTTEKQVKFHVSEVPVICLPLTDPKIDRSILDKFNNLCLADDFTDRRFKKIDILIGQDIFWSLMNGNNFRVNDCNVVAQESVFGWVLCGSSNGGTCSGITLLNINDISDNVVKSFWDLESIGVEDSEPTGDAVLKQFCSTLMTYDTMAAFRLKGRKGKKSFQKLKLYQVIVDAMVDTVKCTEVAAEATISAALKYAPDRRRGGGRSQHGFGFCNGLPSLSLNKLAEMANKIMEVSSTPYVGAITAIFSDPTVADLAKQVQQLTHMVEKLTTVRAERGRRPSKSNSRQRRPFERSPSSSKPHQPRSGSECWYHWHYG
ncbi:hypothetical protein GQR58_022186 [Nymphon striatum]|nr:hypothetical protein GQR58_022186 [Nymphon striatum]